MIAEETTGWSKYSGDAIKGPPLPTRTDRQNYLEQSCINHAAALMRAETPGGSLTLDPADVKRDCSRLLHLRTTVVVPPLTIRALAC